MGCAQEQKRPEPNFYKNLYTGEVFNKIEFEEFRKNLYLKHRDSIKKVHVGFVFNKIEESSDSIIQNFKYNLRVGDEYIIRAKKYDKIGMHISPKSFVTVDGENLQIGGAQSKPMVINFWFIQCRGCVEEIPILNRLQDKYADKVNFVAMTFDNEDDVVDFLKKKDFNYKHLASENWKKEETSLRGYIKKIASYPYPETIFIDKTGTIRFIESVMPYHEDLDVATSYYESLIDKLL